MGKKVQDLSERVAKLDNGKIHTLSAAEEEVLDECGIQKEMELQCPNIDMISEFADRYVQKYSRLSNVAIYLGTLRLR